MKRNFWKIILFFISAAVFLYPAFTSKQWPILDGANLMIHEAGHTIFSPLGWSVNILGGSLLQLVVPIIFALYFFFSGRFFSSSVAMFWLGQNLVNISNYINDAAVMSLPLITGDPSTHDWNQLFVAWNCLGKSAFVASVVYWIGMAVLLWALISGFWIIARTQAKNK
jgi:hypothetical protein